MKNRIFLYKRNSKGFKIIIDPVGVILSPLYIADDDWFKWVEPKLV